MSYLSYGQKQTVRTFNFDYYVVSPYVFVLYIVMFV